MKNKNPFVVSVTFRFGGRVFVQCGQCACDGPEFLLPYETEEEQNFSREIVSLLNQALEQQ